MLCFSQKRRRRRAMLFAIGKQVQERQEVFYIIFRKPKLLYNWKLEEIMRRFVMEL
jgi:hypothetical protein